MANVNNISSNSYSSATSLYGSRNVLTGLASGMDTETMIQNSVVGYQTKISELQQQQTRVEWKQDAYRDLIDQMNSISQKYTSYSSKTNLSSNSFFANAKTTVTAGANASAVSASGTSSSNIEINAVRQMATSTRYAVDVSTLDMKATSEAVGKAIDWSQSMTKGTLSGTLTLKLGSSSVDVKFTDADKYTSLDELVDGINLKLSEQNADVKAELREDGSINFSTTGSAQARGDSVYLRSASGNLRSMFNITTATSTADENRFNYTSFSLQGEASGLTKTMTTGEYLAGKTVDVTLNGTTKQITLGSGLTDTDSLKADLQKSIDSAFGKNKITVNVTDEGGVRFDVDEKSGSTVKVSSSAVGEMLGLGEAGVSNYFNTSQKLGDLLGEDGLRGMRMQVQNDDITDTERYFDKDGNELKKDGDTYYKIDSKGEFILKDNEKVEGTLARTFNVDTSGNLVSNYVNEPGEHYRVNEKGEYLHELKINGTTIGGLTKNTALETVINKINSDADAGVNVSYSNLTGQFVLSARETGAGGEISFDNDLAKKLFYADNKPQSVTAEKLLGDFLNWDEDGNAQIGISGSGTGYLELGTINKNTTVEELISRINNSSSVYSNLISFNEETGAYQLNTRSGGAMTEENANQIRFVNDDTYENIGLSDLIGKLKGGTMTKGVDAVVDVTVNGVKRTLERSSNVIAMDGMNVTLKDTFNVDGTGEAVTFKTETKADDIVDTVKSFVEDVNKLMKDVHDAYTTQPLKKSSTGSTKRDNYMPLTEDDKKDMSESAIKAYEEKAKTGLLFGDTDLSALYSRLLNVVQRSGDERIAMESMGLSTTYSGGVTQIKLDEDKLRTALDEDADKVRSMFTKTKEGGAASDGIMASIKATLNTYGSISLGSQGLLVRKAGTKLSSVSLLNNTLQSQLNNLTSQIEKWQSRLSGKVDYYTKQFTQLEKLMGTMNNQSSMLADLMGG